MPADFNCELTIVNTGSEFGNYLRSQIDFAQKHYRQIEIEVLVRAREILQLDLNGRDFVAGWDWGTLGQHRTRRDKGCDIFVVSSYEKIEGQAAAGLTILPDQPATEGVRAGGINSWPEPNPERPAVIINMNGAPSPRTLAHELGHALLSSKEHHKKPENFMFGDPPHGTEFDVFQIGRLTTSNWLE